MLPSQKSSRLLLGFALLLCAGLFSVSFSLAQRDDLRDDNARTSAVPGKGTFNSNCGACHGLDGRGSEKGPNIAGSVNVRHSPDDRVFAIISSGIPGTGMPAFRKLGEQQIRSVVSYLRILQGEFEGRTLPGDATRGKSIFFGKGECSNCHTISGAGGFLGPDLSAYGSAMSAKAIRDEIVRPARVERNGYRSAVVTTSQGDRLEGVIRNEDNFSLQLQTKDGSFHFLQKSELHAVERSGQSLMPTDYRERLSLPELNDLVSYLMNAGSTPAKRHAPHRMKDATE
jgi:putative heme-binding domain-containing protein